MVSNAEREILRQLGEEYMQLATLPEQKEKIGLWRALNRGEMQRPMVVIEQIPWNELNLDGRLTCKIETPVWRDIEQYLRREIYKYKNFAVDMVLDPFITIPKAIENSLIGIKAQIEHLGEEGSDASSKHYANQIATLDDVQKIKDFVITHDVVKSKERLEQAQYIFDGVAPVRLSGGISFHLGVWDRLTELMSIEDVYLYLYDQPELLHAAMDRITTSTVVGIETANRLEIHNDIANTCHCSYIYTDNLLPDSGNGSGPISKNCWAYGLAQLFTSVSPAIFEEFELPYITRMAEYFGGIYYGCCDRLDNKLDIVKKIPNVKKVSCSPWSDRKIFAENIGNQLIMSSKPSPAYLAPHSFDEDIIRKDLQYTCDLAKQNKVNLELILKDISTVKKDPERLNRWAEIAMEVVGG